MKKTEIHWIVPVKSLKIDNDLRKQIGYGYAEIYVFTMKMKLFSKTLNDEKSGTGWNETFKTF